MDRVLRLEQRIMDVETSLVTSQTNTTSAVETLKLDMDKRMTLQESKTDANTDILQKIWSKVSGEQGQQPPAANQAATYLQAPYQPQMQPQQTWSPQATSRDQPTQTQYYGPAPGGKGGKGYKGYKSKRQSESQCWTCKQYGHIAAHCPNQQPSSQEFVGSSRIAAVQSSVKKFMDAYGTGGTSKLSSDELAAQMGASGDVNVLHVTSDYLEINLRVKKCGNLTYCPKAENR